jgi:succinoglycan biosynthesis protein ExoA
VAATDGTGIRRISIVIPMLNEAAHVDQLVADLAAQDFTGEVKVIVADGCSTDGSPERLREAAAAVGLDLLLLENPQRRVSSGLNLCLEHTDGDLIVRLDCHSRYPPDYLSCCARVSEETGAWNVGGLFMIDARTPMERAFACVLDTPFGGHNWTRTRHQRHDADTVFCGAFRPEAFERAGRYDESIAVTEVEDLNIRIRRAGGRVVYDPSIRVLYVPRDTFRKAFVQYYRYGFWKVAVTVKHRQPLSGRSVVPLAFVVSLGALAATAPRAAVSRRALALELAAYGLCAVGFGVHSVRARGESAALLPRVLALYPTLHLAHGLGSVHGWFGALRRAGS